jgi:hypothetical protein
MNKEQFLVDMPIYPGISGSPVFAISYGNEYYESGDGVLAVNVF